MTYQSTVLARGPVLYLPFTETTGTTFADLSGNGHDGTVHTAPVTVGGTDGPLTGQRAAVLGGSGSEIRFAAGSAFPSMAHWTLDYWLQAPLLDEVNVFDMGFAFFGSSRIGQDLTQSSLDFTKLEYLFNLYDGAPHQVHADPVTLASPLCWHYYAVAYDGTVVKLYIDAVLAATLDDSTIAPPGGTIAGFTLAPTAGGNWINSGDGSAFNLNHSAFYPAALSPSAIAANFAAMTPRQDDDCFVRWVRVAHRSGQGFWQSKGDVTEEWADGAVRVRMPFATLSAAPTVLLGKDPSTDLPAFCPAPISSTTTVVLGGGEGSVPAPPVSCVHMRCGVSTECMNHLLSLYDKWSMWLDPLVGGLVTFGVIALAIDPFFDALVGGLALASDIAIANGIRSVLKLATGVILGAVFPDPNSDQQDEMQRPLFCHLTCAGDVVVITSADISFWHDAVASQGDLLGLSRDLLALLLLFTPLSDWQAVASGSGTSSACDGWTCP